MDRVIEAWLRKEHQQVGTVVFTWKR